MKNLENTDNNQLTARECFDKAQKFEKEEKYIEARTWYEEALSKNIVNFSDLSSIELIVNTHSNLGNIASCLASDRHIAQKESQTFSHDFDPIAWRIFYLQEAIEHYTTTLGWYKEIIKELSFNLKSINPIEQKQHIDFAFQYTTSMIQANLHLVHCMGLLHKTRANNGEMKIDNDMGNSIVGLRMELKQIETYINLVDQYSSAEHDNLLQQKKGLAEEVDTLEFEVANMGCSDGHGTNL